MKRREDDHNAPADGAQHGADPPPEEQSAALSPALSSVVGYLLRRSHNAFQAYWMASFRDSDTPITPVQGGMLVVLASNPGLTQTALARMMNVEGPTLMQSIDRLEEQGYLQRLRRGRRPAQLFPAADAAGPGGAGRHQRLPAAARRGPADRPDPR